MRGHLFPNLLLTYIPVFTDGEMEKKKIGNI